MGLTERASRLMRDLLHQLYDAILEMAITDEKLLGNRVFTRRLDALLEAIGSVTVVGEIEVEDAETSGTTRKGGVSAEATGSASGLRARLGGERARTAEERDSSRTIRRGEERLHLNFTDVAKALRELGAELGRRRIWLLIDEWSSVPAAIQPYLAEFLVRCVLPLQQQFTVKIASIEQQSHFRSVGREGGSIGIEVGADVSANLDLDDFMVFEQSEERAREFFLGLFYKHLTSGFVAPIDGLNGPNDVVRLGFTDRRALDELVRAAEGVPRDAINIAGNAALKALDRKISVPEVRGASRTWYHSDKEAALKGVKGAQELLSWIIDEVIRGRRARGFLVNRRDAQTPLLVALFEARVLHLVRRGYSAQDEPGERYDVYVIDYGAYVDLINTNSSPQGMLPGIEQETYVDVPPQDLRAIRRAILDMDRFTAAKGEELANPDGGG
ncbi:hypothetical protein [Phycicoccus sp. Soil748]|uniref:hypothetical protein n=1 Tax=Phycicoccus sp. Soil748 TaxID=1736397 RepID=UPI001910DC4C|nr:hypothetical protein [Phycicoccus sp. Soil748]